jgi:site-specific DNA-methyltransferase (adenine-specific)
MINELMQCDCMDYMKTCKDKQFDLAIVDPPYGIGEDNMTGGAGKNKQWEKGKQWDLCVPNETYFSELFRVSCNQIIWGGNYFLKYLKSTKCYLIWDKQNDNRDFAESEFAWSSFDEVSRTFRMRPMNMAGGKIHPTQKPIALYKWLLSRYAKPGDKLLDTHSGSGSFRIAAYDMGFDLVSCEIDADYCRDNEARYQAHIAQQELIPVQEIQQLTF